MTELDLYSQLPFISIIQYGNEEYVGIIINQDAFVTSFYDLSLIKLQEERIHMMELCEIWWYESNHRIPINIFLKNQLDIYRYAIKTFITKDVHIVMGPVVNLSTIADKRPKRRTVQLVKSTKSHGMRVEQIKLICTTIAKA
jgi:hypothetical protein